MAGHVHRWLYGGMAVVFRKVERQQLLWCCREVAVCDDNDVTRLLWVGSHPGMEPEQLYVAAMAREWCC